MSKKMRVLQIIIVFLAIITIMGCGPIGGPGEEEGEFEPHSGYGSLEMHFSPGSPPDVIYSNQQSLPFLLELRNRGASQLTGTGYISGFDPGIISMSGQQFSISLEPVTTFNQEGGFDIVQNVNLQSINMPAGLDRYTPTLLVTACYNYKTEASIEICVDPNPYRGTEKTCRAGVVSVGGGQGAPIAISSVEQEIIPAGGGGGGGRMLFKVRLSNSDVGELVTNGADCSKPLEYNQIDLIETTPQINIPNRGISNIQPSPVKFTNGQATVYFEADLPTSGTEYVTAMTVVLDYRYRKTYSKRIEIRNVKSYR